MTRDELERIIWKRVIGGQRFDQIAASLGYPVATVVEAWRAALRAHEKRWAGQSTTAQPEAPPVVVVPQPEEEWIPDNEDNESGHETGNWAASLPPGLHIHGVAPNLWRKGPGIRLAIPPAWRERIIRLCAETCQYCGRSGDSAYGPDWHPWHIDHIVPVAEGGNTTLDNLTLACQRCNLSKGAGRWTLGVLRIWR